MELAYKFRIYPDKVQKQQIKKNIGCARFLYNHFLSQRRALWKDGQKTITRFEQEDQIPELKKRYPWLTEADSTALQSAAGDLNRAYTLFLKQKAGYPQFRSENDPVRSYTSKMSHDNIRVDTTKNTVRLPKIGPVKCGLTRPVEGRILSATVSVTRDEKYFISLTCTGVPEHPLPATGRTAEIDSLAENADIEKEKRRLERMRRAVLRQQPGSENYKKTQALIEKQAEKIRRKQADAAHKAAAALVKENDTIRLLPANTLSAESKRMLKYKCMRYGRTLIE